MTLMRVSFRGDDLFVLLDERGVATTSGWLLARLTADHLVEIEPKVRRHYAEIGHVDHPLPAGAVTVEQLCDCLERMFSASGNITVERFDREIMATARTDDSPSAVAVWRIAERAPDQYGATVIDQAAIDALVDIDPVQVAYGAAAPVTAGAVVGLTTGRGDRGPWSRWGGDYAVDWAARQRPCGYLPIGEARRLAPDEPWR